ncbi:MAG TPA: hypothetical protein VLA60_17655 [Nitrospirales bacterium]|nr:hypothetical protein [Nitrospirales bacterium]
MKNTQQAVNLKAKRHAPFFGPDSEWATSAKLLEKFYEKEAQNRERLAILHAEAGRLHPHSPGLETR